jgi:hypothetical protein
MEERKDKVKSRQGALRNPQGKKRVLLGAFHCGHFARRTEGIGATVCVTILNRDAAFDIGGDGRAVAEQEVLCCAL